MMQAWLRRHFQAALIKRNWPLAILLFAIIFLVTLVLFVGQAKAGAWVTITFDNSVPKVIEWGLAAYGWPFSPIVAALALFVVAVVIIAIINRMLTNKESTGTPEVVCAREHVSADGAALQAWTNRVRSDDQDNLQRVLRCEATCTTESIFGTDRPSILLDLLLESSSVYTLRISCLQLVKRHRLGLELLKSNVARLSRNR